jgi:hypothetical protein
VTGAFTYGFSIGTDTLPLGDFVAHVFAECINDGLAFQGAIAATPSRSPTPGATVPEPALTLALAGVTVMGLQLRRGATAGSLGICRGEASWQQRFG